MESPRTTHGPVERALTPFGDHCTVARVDPSDRILNSPHSMHKSAELWINIPTDDVAIRAHHHSFINPDIGYGPRVTPSSCSSSINCNYLFLIDGASQFDAVAGESIDSRRANDPTGTNLRIDKGVPRFADVEDWCRALIVG